MEIGNDYVHIDALNDSNGGPITSVPGYKGPAGQYHGYVKKWWESK
jgi:hypothetical protein